MNQNSVLDNLKVFKPSLKQQLAWYYLHDSVTTEIGYGGGANGGKSWLISVFITITCLKYAGVAFGLGRKELVTLKKTTLRTLFKVFNFFGLKKKFIMSTINKRIPLLFLMVVLFFFLIWHIDQLIHFIQDLEVLN